MRAMTASEIRALFLKFMESKGHTVIPSASVIPQGDSNVLFTIAGMHPLIPYLMGQPHPQGTRITDVQKCVRTNDIESVGDASHLTFFEMLGNWSLGDYFKEEAIAWSWEFLTSPEWLGIDKDRLAFSVFAGDENAPRDDEAAECWRKCGVAEDHLFYLPAENNWWSTGGPGPCGPDTEMFYINTAKEPCGPDCSPACDCGRYLEIWNDVFMQYNLKEDGTYEPLAKKNVDTGMGLERTAGVLMGKKSVYETDLFSGILDKIGELSGKTYGEDEETTRSMRIIADHLRTSVMILGDDHGVTPSNTDQGYILRRLIRRAVRHGMKIGLQEGAISEIVKVITKQYEEVYPEIKAHEAFITEQLQLEETRFQRTLRTGEKEFDKVYSNMMNLKNLLESILKAEDKVALAQENAKTKKLRPSPDLMPIIEAANAGDESALVAAVNARLSGLNVLDGRSAFKLYDTYGFPIEMTIEMAEEKGLTVDEADFAERFKKHQETSHAGAEQKFKGGLAERTEQTAKLHTATHLLHAALRKVLGDEVAQKGSNITEERLRFDFSFGRKMTKEEVEEVQKLVNEAIAAKAPITMEEMSVEAAKAQGAIGLFEAKYGEVVKVYTMGQYSKEICGGPHASNTGDLGSFKIQKEESSSAGVRRIKATIA
ncbi:MAG: alanine--tRNA ligase [Clostridia bacterium]|nr:alanine--tRNA ligase [Clostridia bacterium]